MGATSPDIIRRCESKMVTHTVPSIAADVWPMSESAKSCGRAIYHSRSSEVVVELSSPTSRTSGEVVGAANVAVKVKLPVWYSVATEE